MSGSDDRSLSQEEVDALLQRIQNEARKPEPMALGSEGAEENGSAPGSLAVSVTPPRLSNLGVLDHVADFPVRLSVEVGRSVAPMATWRKLGIGSRVTLDCMVQDPVTIRINGHLVGNGVVVLIGNRFGVQIKHWGTIENSP